ncbi:MAG TPA: hypothetical protein PLG43_07870 [Spirochaetia bacterium]|nr:hypothetical protein [Spirochaetia bacterium]
MKTKRPLYPVEIVLHPDWWNAHEGITFDRDFFFHPKKRVEEEAHMEKALYERWGKFGLGSKADIERPEVGAVHLAAGFMLSEMLGCPVRYLENSAPQVIPAGIEDLDISPEAAFASTVYRDFVALLDSLKRRYGSLSGDVNWGGILNIALDLRGEKLFMDFYDQPEKVRTFFHTIASVLDRFTRDLARETGTTSISVNRITRFFDEPILLHSECTHTMISEDIYEEFLLAFDRKWSTERRPFGIHYCGADPHRYAKIFAKLPHLDFLDLGWGGDIAELRRYLPHTFFSIRLSPVEIVQMQPEEIESLVVRLAAASAVPELTGFCCINLDHTVSDEQVAAIYTAAEGLRQHAALSPE